MSMQITDPRATNNSGTAESGVVSFGYPVGTTAVKANDLVALLCDSVGRITVTPAASGVHAASTKCAVAKHAGLPGEVVQCVVLGPALVNAPGTAPAIGAGIGIGATAGVIAGVTADATTVVGTVKGVVLTAEVGTSDKVWAWVQ